MTQEKTKQEINDEFCGLYPDYCKQCDLITGCPYDCTKKPKRNPLAHKLASRRQQRPQDGNNDTN